MFVKPIRNSTFYTKPLITGKVLYKNNKILNEINTLIVLNKNGDILTTSYIADLFLIEEDINEVYPPILKEIRSSTKKNRKKIENKYGINNDTVVLLHNILIDIADKPGKLNIIKHNYLDLAIIKIEHKSKILVDKFPMFSFTYDVGTMVCGVGYAFPEFDTFEFDKMNNKMITTNKVMNFPIFPLNGMITRLINDQNNKLSMFETSMQAIPGQYGGPVLNKEGHVIGMLIGSKKITHSIIDDNFSFLDLGVAINSFTITKFLNENGIEYNKIDNKVVI